MCTGVYAVTASWSEYEALTDVAQVGSNLAGYRARARSGLPGEGGDGNHRRCETMDDNPVPRVGGVAGRGDDQRAGVRGHRVRGDFAQHAVPDSPGGARGGGAGRGGLQSGCSGVF